MQPETQELLERLNREFPNWASVDALPQTTYKPINEIMGFAEFIGKPLTRFAKYDKC